jgi:CheY-like chemotaxis protein
MGSVLEEKLRALRHEFLDGLPARADELERWQRDASLGPEVLGRLCHRLRGLAPTHGLVEVGRLAATIEDKVRGGASRAALADDAATLVQGLRAPTERVHDPLDAPLQPLRGYRVVAIDDDASMRRLLLLTLRDLGGADATVVEHEAEFVAALELGPADLVIADVMMPSTTGPALLARAEAAALLGPARVVVLSGSGEAPEASRWTRLSKPFRPDELVGALTALLRGAR